MKSEHLWPLPLGRKRGIKGKTKVFLKLVRFYKMCPTIGCGLHTANTVPKVAIPGHLVVKIKNCNSTSLSNSSSGMKPIYVYNINHNTLKN